MAVFGIFVAFGDDKSAAIKGNSKVAGYEGWVLGESVSLGASAERGNGPTGKRDGKATAHMSAMALTVHGGSATAEMYDFCMKTKMLKTVHIHQCLQPVDKASTQQPELIQKIDLKTVYITGVSEVWSDQGDRMVTLSLDYAHFMVTVGTKPADITLRNVSAAEGAK